MMILARRSLTTTLLSLSLSLSLSPACAPPEPMADAGPDAGEPSDGGMSPDTSGTWFRIEEPVFPYDMLEVLTQDPLGDGGNYEQSEMFCRLREVETPSRSYADRETEVFCAGTARPNGYLLPFMFPVPFESTSRTLWIGDDAIEWEYWQKLQFTTGDEEETHSITFGDPLTHDTVAAGVHRESTFRSSRIHGQSADPTHIAAVGRIAIATGGSPVSYYGVRAAREVTVNFAEAANNRTRTGNGFEVELDPDDGEIVSATNGFGFQMTRLDEPPDVTLPGGPQSPEVFAEAFDFTVPGPSSKETVTVTGAGGLELGCDLYLPDAQTFDVVVILHGSGRYTRNFEGFIEKGSFLAQLSEDLADAGYGALMCDKRATREGEGEQLLSELVADYVAEVQTMAADARVENVYTMGLSLGSILSSRVATQSGADGAIYLAACRDVLEGGIEMMTHAAEVTDYPAADLDDLVTQVRADYPSVLDGTFPVDERRFFHGFFALGDLAWWQDQEGVDPIAEGSATDFPALVVHGSKDSQCPQSSYDAYVSGWAQRADTTFALIDGADHVLRQAYGGPLQRGWAMGLPIVPEARAAILDWLNAR